MLLPFCDLARNPITGRPGPFRALRMVGNSSLTRLRKGCPLLGPNLTTGLSYLPSLAHDLPPRDSFLASLCSRKNAHICFVASMLWLYRPTIHSAATRLPPGH